MRCLATSGHLHTRKSAHYIYSCYMWKKCGRSGRCGKESCHFDHFSHFFLAFPYYRARIVGFSLKRTDIYVIGKMLEVLPNSNKYNKVIARCTAVAPEDRYQSVQDVLNAVSQRHRSHWAVVAIALLVLAGLLATCLYLISLRHPVITPIETEALIQVAKDSVSHTVSQPQKTPDSQASVPSEKPSKQVVQKDDLTLISENIVILQKITAHKKVIC